MITYRTRQKVTPRKNSVISGVVADITKFAKFTRINTAE